jgi:hypothetical protein
MYKSTLTLKKTLILIGTCMFASMAFAQTTGTTGGTNTTGGTGTTGGTNTTGGTGTTGSTDQAACYEWDKFPNERFNLNVKMHSSLSSGTSGSGGTGGTDSSQGQQTAYSVHGKHVIGSAFMATVEGTVVTAGETSGTTGTTGTNTGSTGAHLGLLAKWVRGDGQTADFVRSVTVDCTSDEASSTPNTWTCESRNEFDIYHGSSRLTKVDETQDQACNAFEDSQQRANASLTANSLQGVNSSVLNSNQGQQNQNQNQQGQNPAQ